MAAFGSSRRLRWLLAVPVWARGKRKGERVARNMFSKGNSISPKDFEGFTFGRKRASLSFRAHPLMRMLLSGWMVNLYWHNLPARVLFSLVFFFRPIKRFGRVSITHWQLLVTIGKKLATNFATSLNTLICTEYKKNSIGIYQNRFI